ncbi:recombinase family protein [Aestuariicella hydrocarbonica]|uniref:Recombinase family protein n=1 Tax=Pseudomaricurvus hydrocarbonicus TaxID=1470433 RepID=A0A9E5MNS8_9GAMM|nr:recombinase family protein [Aestuariicella hydrocarbonica]NHO67691.1 recombinase family protein [Aestuariicella hydrocarbonica]
MTIFAYCRVSTLDQETAIQEEAIRKSYPQAKIRHEKKSGASTQGREVLLLLLDVIAEGDKLVVWKLDRLARNLHDLTTIVKALEDKGASLEILDQRIDTGTASGRAFLQMLGVFAEFETNLRKERQAAGIAKAKSEGRYTGRQPAAQYKVTKAIRLVEAGYSKQKAASEAGIGVATLYRRLKEIADDK